MLTTIDRSKLALCPLCSMPAIMENPYVREDALWISCLRLQGRGDRAEAGGNGR